MAVNPLKAVLDAIAESDAEIGGILNTFLSEAHEWGANIGQLQAASPDVLTSYAYDKAGQTYGPFKATDLGKGIDILPKASPTGNEGPCVVTEFLSDTQVRLEKLDGSAPAFVDESGVQWRFSTLRTRGTWEFPIRDILMQLWVGTTPHAVPYCEVVSTPGAEEFRGIGEYRNQRDGVIEPGSTLRSRPEFFTADDVGKGVWILPTDPANGNEGPRIIATFVDSRTVTVSGAPFVASETEAMFAVQTLSGEGYLEEVQREDTEVVDASVGYAALDRLRRAFWLDFADAGDLDRVGRNVAVTRPKIFDDKTHRRYIAARAFLPSQGIEGLEIILNAIYPEGGWEIYEDLSEGNAQGNNNKVFVFLPGTRLGQDYEGRGFVMARQEGITPDTSTQITLTAGTPIEAVTLIRPRRIEQDTEMDALPSAGDWTYDAEGEVTEANTFSVSGSILSHTMAATALGGKYTQETLRAQMRWQYDPVFEMSAWWKSGTITTVGGFPWHLAARFDPYQAFFEWDDAGGFRVADETGGTVVASVAGGPATADGAWHQARMVIQGRYLRCYWDGVDLFGAIDVETLPAFASPPDVDFGYKNRSQTQDWTVQWDRVHVVLDPRTNYANATVEAADLSNPGTVFDSAGPFVAADQGRHARVYSGTPKSDGLWLIQTYTSTQQIDLAGIQRDPASVRTADGRHYVEIDEPWFSVAMDATKQIKITGSLLGNNSTREVLEVVSPYLVEVDGADFVSEAGLTWEFDPDFGTENGILVDVIDTVGIASNVLTTRDAMPLEDFDVTYSAMPSAQLLKNEFVTNEGSGGSAGNVYYPLYLLDADLIIQGILDDVTAAGVIPHYNRTY